MCGNYYNVTVTAIKSKPAHRLLLGTKDGRPAWYEVVDGKLTGKTIIPRCHHTDTHLVDWAISNLYTITIEKSEG